MNIKISKICCRCKIDKSFTDFHKGLKNKDGLSKQCKECERKKCQLYYQSNKDKIKEKTKDYMKKYLKEYYKKNNIIIKERSVKRYVNNKDNIREWSRIYSNKRRKEDLNFKLLRVLRSRLSNAINRDSKSLKTKELLGCTIDEFKIYIESLFKGGMSWDNYGLKGWHIDHIIPCDYFNLNNIEEQRQCFHYTNLQPMWAKENHSKSNKILNPIQTKILI